MCRRANRIGTINKECPLLIIEQARTALIHNKASCQRTKGRENSGAPLFTKLNARKQASPANCMRRLRQCALLQRCSTRFKRSEPARERRRLGLCGASGTFTLANCCSGGGGA